jgi:hypothetical protein
VWCSRFLFTTCQWIYLLRLQSVRRWRAKVAQLRMRQVFPPFSFSLPLCFAEMACCIPFYPVAFWTFQTHVHVSTTFLLMITTVAWQMHLVYNSIVTGFWIPDCSLSTYTWVITWQVVFSFILFESNLYAQDISCLKPFMCWTGTSSKTWWTYDHMCEWYEFLRILVIVEQISCIA